MNHFLFQPNICIQTIFLICLWLVSCNDQAFSLY